MFRRKFIRTGAALLMILALSLPAFTPSALAAHTVGAVSPASGGSGGGQTVTIAGTAFDTQGVDQVCFGATAAQIIANAGVCAGAAVGAALGSTPVVAVGGGSLTTVTPTHPAGAAAVAVHHLAALTDPDWIDATNTFLYVNPTATSVGPPSGTAGTTVTIFDGTAPGNFHGVTDVGYIGPLPAVTSTSDTGTPVVSADGTTITSVVPATLAVGTYTISLTNAQGTFVQTVSFTVSAVAGTATLTAVPSPTTIAGTGCLTFTITGILPAAGPLPVTVVMVNAATGAVTVQQSTVPAAGTATVVFCNIGLGNFRLTTANNYNDDAAGNFIDTRLITVTNVSSSGVVTAQWTGTGPATTVALAAKVPPAALTDGSTGVFGYAVNPVSGAPIVGATVIVTLSASGTQVGTGTTDSNGRFQISGLPVSSSVTVTLQTSGTIGLSCLNVPGAPAPENTTCVDILTTGAVNTWMDPAFLATTSTVGTGQGVLQGVIPMVFRDTDTSRTGGVNIETDSIRVMNAGLSRTQACLDFRTSDSDGRSTGVSRQCLDLNPQAAGIWAGNIIPSGIMGMAEIFSVDLDGVCTTPPITGITPTPTPGPSAFQGCVYDISDLHSVVVYRVADANDATAGINGLTCEDVTGTVAACGLAQQTTQIPIQPTASQNVVIPVAFKNYGGTPAKWDSVVNVCMTSGVPARQPLVMEFFGTGTTRGTYLETRSADPGGCVTFNMRDIAYLPNGTYAISLTSTGLVGAPLPSGQVIAPNAFFGASVAYTRGSPGFSGGGATAHNGIGVVGGGTILLGTTSRVYVPLVFSDFVTGGGSWSSGLGLINFPTTGTSGSVSFTVAIYDDAGTNRGIINQRGSGQTGTVFWFGVQPGTENRGLWDGGTLVVPLERNFRGALIVDSGDASGAARPFVFAHHTNYARNAHISYNGIRDQVVSPNNYAPPIPVAPNSRPCAMTINTQLNTTPSVPDTRTCLWAAEIVKITGGTGAPRGLTSGIRLFNPTATAELVDVQHFDSAGIEWQDSRTTFTIGPFSTATLFQGADARLPANFTGSIYVTSQAAVTGLVNVVDYGVTTRDGSRAYNLPSQTGLTQ